MAFFDAFGVDVFKLAFQIINFLLILYLLNRFLFKRVLALLDERQERISKGLEDAEAAARDRELARAEREAALDEARKEAQAMIARATKIAEESRGRDRGRRARRGREGGGQSDRGDHRGEAARDRASCARRSRTWRSMPPAGSCGQR